MIARIQLLRRAGVLLAAEHGGADSRWSDEGYVETVAGGACGPRGRRLALRALGSAPGQGLMAELYGPALVSIDHAVLRVRGIERIDTPAGPAAVVQEWPIRPRQ